VVSARTPGPPHAGVLDDAVRLAAIDEGGMLGHIRGLGAQLRRGYAAGRGTRGLPEGDGVRSIAVCGMGGSGIAGDILRCLYAGRIPVPITVTKGYGLPEFAGRDSLVLALSFSGNTEETLSAYAAAVSRGCRVVTVSAGGELAERSAADGAAHVVAPADVPMPRMAVGDLTSSLLGVLEVMGVIPPARSEIEEAAALLDDLSTRLGPDRPTGENPAKELAEWIGARTPVVWGSEGIAEAPAGRFRTQVNENAKSPAFSGVLPELDHNDIEGWSAGTGEPFALVILRHAAEHPRIEARVIATLESIASSGLESREVWAEGREPLASLFSLIAFADFTATYLGILRGVDPSPIPVLSSLKGRLAG
jgi:glucose/mannose-6-phosphate isomerase